VACRARLRSDHGLKAKTILKNMPLDPEVTKSVEDAVKKHHQSTAVAKRLLAWLHAISGSSISREKEMELFNALADAIEPSTAAEEV